MTKGQTNPHIATWIQKSPGYHPVNGARTEGVVIITQARIKAVHIGEAKRDPKTGAHVTSHMWVCETRDWKRDRWDVVTETFDITIARRWLFQIPRR